MDEDEIAYLACLVCPLALGVCCPVVYFMLNSNIHSEWVQFVDCNGCLCIKINSVLVVKYKR